MAPAKYILIDKNIIKESMEFLFDIFISSSSKKEMKLFKKKRHL